MSRYLTELVGTYFLVFTIGMVVVAGTPLAPLAVGLMLTALVYMGGPVSGAHYNPAVTVGFYLTGTTVRRDVLPYVAAQLLGAWLAAGTVHLLTGQTFAPGPGRGYTVAQALLAEALLTLALVLVIFNVAISRHSQGNQYYGVAIGLVVTGGAFTVGDVSGAAFNPAVGTGPMLVDALMGGGSLGHLWLYWVGPVAGALGALAIFRVQEGRAGE
jgi:aquaporin Z